MTFAGAFAPRHGASGAALVEVSSLRPGVSRCDGAAAYLGDTASASAMVR